MKNIRETQFKFCIYYSYVEFYVNNANMKSFSHSFVELVNCTRLTIPRRVVFAVAVPMPPFIFGKNPIIFILLPQPTFVTGETSGLPNL